MKKSIYLIFILGLMMSCSQGKKQNEKSAEVLQEQSVKIENSVQQLDESIKASDKEMKETQSEIDLLLNGI